MSAVVLYLGVPIERVGLSWYVGGRWFPTRAAARDHVREAKTAAAARIAARNTSTCATCPRYIWKHEVLMGAIAKGADGEACRIAGDELVGTGPGQTRLSLWYTSGEPVWMAADTLADLVKLRARESRLVRAPHALGGRL